jgi:hypothetical protein
MAPVSQASVASALSLAAISAYDYARRTEQKIPGDNMFKLYPSMGFGRRLAVWWSCVWRQMLTAVPVWVVATAGGTIWTLVRMHHGQPMKTAVLMPLLVVTSGTFVLMLPVAGYMVRRGFASHGLPAPDKLRLWSATMLGLSTVGWSLLFTGPVAVVAHVLQPEHRMLALALNLLASIIVGLYVILPRQALRLARQLDAGRSGTPA